MKVRVDAQRCQGHTLCAMIAPDMFRLDDIDGTSAAVCEVVPPGREDIVREAARSCPEQAIVVEQAHNGSSRFDKGQEVRGQEVRGQEVREATS